MLDSRSTCLAIMDQKKLQNVQLGLLFGLSFNVVCQYQSFLVNQIASRIIVMTTMLSKSPSSRTTLLLPMLTGLQYKIIFIVQSRQKIIEIIHILIINDLNTIQDRFFKFKTEVTFIHSLQPRIEVSLEVIEVKVIEVNFELFKGFINCLENLLFFHYWPEIVDFFLYVFYFKIYDLAVKNIKKIVGVRSSTECRHWNVRAQEKNTPTNPHPTHPHPHTHTPPLPHIPHTPETLFI
jgi:hypothetical protein